MRFHTESGIGATVALAPAPTAAGAVGNRTAGPAPAAGTTESRSGDWPSVRASAVGLGVA